MALGLKRGKTDVAFQEAKEGEFALLVETVNGIGMRATKERLMCTEARIVCVCVCAQETWVSEGDIAKWSAWARRRGWKSSWEPAARKAGATRGAGGGVAIFVRA